MILNIRFEMCLCVASIRFFFMTKQINNTKKKFACNRSEKFIFNTRCSDVYGTARFILHPPASHSAVRLRANVLCASERILTRSIINCTVRQRACFDFPIVQSNDLCLSHFYHPIYFHTYFPLRSFVYSFFIYQATSAVAVAIAVYIHVVLHCRHREREIYLNDLVEAKIAFAQREQHRCLVATIFCQFNTGKSIAPIEFEKLRN